MEHRRRGATANTSALRPASHPSASSSPPRLPRSLFSGEHAMTVTMPTPANHAWTAWPRAAADAASSALAAVVFAFLDVVDVLLCFVYGFLDDILEDRPTSCYCHRSLDEDEEEEVSDTLYVRRSVCRDALTGLVRRVVRRRSGRAPENNKAAAAAAAAPWKPRWSDCGCASCVEWRWKSGGDDGVGLLHVVVKEPAPRKDGTASGTQTAAENAIFIHGFTSSSSFWAETVFPELESSSALDNCRLFAVDLLGFGRSPKPANCMYRLRDHVDAIERSVVEPMQLESFHLVSHSMGCIIALALAARHPSRVKSITLVAPPYFPACEQSRTPSQVALSRLAEKKLWPPLLFGSAVMTWYEHIGRTVCLVVCKHHRLWERLLKLLAGNNKREDVDFRLRDLTKHTHHSGWHTMHNVICGGARLQDRHLEAVEAAGVPVRVVHGVKDQVVPVECSRHLKAKLPRAEVRLLHGRDHSTVIFGREKGFVEELREFWWSGASSS